MHRSKRRLLVLGLRTWGQLGNLLAAQKLAHILADAFTDWRVDVRAAEELWPFLGDIGQAMSQAVICSSSPEEVRSRYMAVIRETEDLFPTDFEESGAARISIASPTLGDDDLSIVIGTKGIVSRLASAEVTRIGRGVPVINFVTNHGLLELELHRSSHVAHHLVPLKVSRSRLVNVYNVDPRSITVVGPLPFSPTTSISSSNSRANLFATCSSQDRDRARVVVFSNRGGVPYLEVASVLARHPARPEVMFVAYGDVETASAAEAIRINAGATDWVVLDRLDQSSFYAALQRAATHRNSFIITKTGPNTVLEAVRLGLPVLLHRSGLPMEDWIIEFVRDTRIGDCVSSSRELPPLVERWLDHPAELIERRQQIAVTALLLDGHDVRNRIVQAVRNILHEHGGLLPSFGGCATSD